MVRTGEHVPHTLWSGMSFVFRLVNEVRAGRWVVWEVTVVHEDIKGVVRTLKELELHQAELQLMARNKLAKMDFGDNFVVFQCFNLLHFLGRLLD